MIGQTISHYNILEKLGEGGMGVVYKAQDTMLNRLVALKFLPTHLTSDETSRRRFITEAQAASALDHHNICNIHEIDESNDGQQFICMAYYEGQSLREKIRKGPIPLDEALNIIVQISQGLNTTHEKKIVHRDIKPSNIIISKGGVVKILDFGLAKLKGEKQTETVSTKGTIAYMSPEVIRGLPVDHRADIWSLGVMLYEMLTGYLPFNGNYAEPMMYSVVNEEPKSLSQYLIDVPELLQKIIDKLLKKNLQERYQSISYLLLDLEPLINENVFSIIKTKPVLVELLVRKKAYLYGSIAILLVIMAIILGKPYLFPESSAGISIAMLPLDSITQDPEHEYFAYGMTDALITELAQISALKVISRSSAMQYKGTSKTAQEIAAELGVEYLVDGSVVRMGNLIKVSARLIDALKDEYIWAKEYEREFMNILGLQGEIATNIANQIEAQLTPQEEKRLAEKRPVNPEAYVLYTKGKFHLNKLTPEGIKTGMSYLKQAVKIDSTDPLPYAQLAIGYGHIAHSTSPEAVSALDLAGKAADKALELDENIAEAHLAKAMRKIYHNWDIDGAEESYKRAIELKPSFAYAHFHYAFLLVLKYNSPNAHEEIQKAKLLDPLSPFYPAEVGWMYYIMGQYDRALEEASLSLELSPDFPFAYFVMGQAYSGKKMYEEAIEYQKRVSEMTFDWKWGLAHAYALAGNVDEAIKIALELENRNAVWDTWCLAVIYSAIGNSNKMFYWLEKAFKFRHPYIQWFSRNTYFNDYKDDPRYASLVQRMNLPE